MLRRGTRLEGKVAIVTGAGTRSGNYGTGQATSILFAREGAKVLLVDQELGNAEKTLATIKEEGGEASVFQGDVSKNTDCKAMVEAALERYSGLHILFNNVGIGRGGGNVIDIKEEDWDIVMDVNLKSMMLTSKYAIPRMIESGGGSIINVSSIDGIRASRWHDVSYQASKGGVIALTVNMAVQHGRDNVRVNCIAPGHLYASVGGERLSDEMRDLRRRAGPLGTEGTAWDIAWATLFLASDESRWISGVVLPVDAGLLAATPLSVLPNLL